MIHNGCGCSRRAQIIGNTVARFKTLLERLGIGSVPRPWLLIYQMGKVGSQTVEATLREANLPHHISRLHFLSPKHQNHFSRWLECASAPQSAQDSLRKQLAEASLAYREVILRKRKQNPKCKLHVVTGVREPVGLLLSSIFQNRADYFPDLSQITAEACRDVLLASPELGEPKRHKVQDVHSFVHGWFEAELNGVLGIDVFAQPFPHAQGYAIYENALARVLVYRYEDFGRIQSMLENFLGVRLNQMVDRNLATQKDYGSTYLRVKHRLNLPESFLAEQYDSRLACHFYTREQREQFRTEWRAGGSSTGDGAPVHFQGAVAANL